jgi:DNA-directed RNA polymerase subunit RPC12/RpoP
MAAWVLGCPNCKSEFAHAKIDETKFVDYMQPKRPVFPYEGLEIDCPNCTHRSVYYHHELRYRLGVGA